MSLRLTTSTQITHISDSEQPKLQSIFVLWNIFLKNELLLIFKHLMLHLYVL